MAFASKGRSPRRMVRPMVGVALRGDEQGYITLNTWFEREAG